MNKNNEVYLVGFYSQTFIFTKLNYNTYDKELLVIFEAFRILYYYLKDLAFSINIVTTHKNLKYFFTTKILVYISTIVLSHIVTIINFNTFYKDIYIVFSDNPIYYICYDLRPCIRTKDNFCIE